MRKGWTFWALPRLVRRALAAVGGYFFLPCPVCGTEFAGFEWVTGAIIWDPDDPTTGHGICPRCFRDGKANTR